MATEDPHAARRLDAVAVQATLRRLARAPEPPWLHAEVARRMAQRLEIVRARPNRILDWWSGLGAGAAELQRVHPQAGVVAVEPEAIWAARTRAARARPWWRRADPHAAASQVHEEADEIAPGAGLVWANMMLHAVVDPPALFARWEALLAPEGFVMFSCLGPGSLRELRTLYDGLGWGSATPGFVDMHDLGDMLVRAGFADPVMDQEVLTLTWPDAEALLAELRGLGGNAAPDRHPGLRTPRWRQHLLEGLAAMAGADGRIALSFEVAYGHAFKAAPRLRTDAPTRVSLDSMRSLLPSRRDRNAGRALG
ncbi:MAG: methyltransferase domain-containing protein [Burkholderiaceae bacterium]